MGGRVDVGEERGHNCPTQSTMMMITTVALDGSKQSAAREVIGGQLGQVSSNVMKEPSEVC